MGLKLFLRSNKKKLDNGFKKSKKEIKRLGKEDAEKILESYLKSGEADKALVSKAKKMAYRKSPEKFLKEWQEFNEKAYAQLLKLELIRELKKKIG